MKNQIINYFIKTIGKEVMLTIDSTNYVCRGKFVGNVSDVHVGNSNNIIIELEDSSLTIFMNNVAKVSLYEEIDELVIKTADDCYIGCIIV